MKKWTFILVLAAIALTSLSFKKKNPPAKKKTAAMVAVSKSLIFPVAGKKSTIGSFWGAERDGGRRSHEGIDIFASKGTPVVAISDGIIANRGTYPRGGKVLWLKSTRHRWTAYYAHLDKQLVKEGQFVRKGQVIGTVGKTGNARTTPPHLHFGIYTGRGAVNPLPYVKHAPKLVIAKKATKKKVPASKRTKSNIKRTRK